MGLTIYHGEIDKWKNQAKKSYELRSDLVHGSQSLYNTYNIELNFNPFKLAYPVILSACIGFYMLGLELNSYEEKLKNMYFELSELCKDEKYKTKEVMNS